MCSNRSQGGPEQLRPKGLLGQKYGPMTESTQKYKQPYDLALPSVLHPYGLEWQIKNDISAGGYI